MHPTNTYCQGVSLPLHRGTVADQTLILTQIRFSMICEVYLRTRGGKTAAKFARVSLPSSCSKKWCLDGSRVYLLDDQAQSCPFKRIRSLSLRQEGSLMISDKYMANLDNRVITQHLSVQPCNDLYPILVRSTTSGWISVSTRVLQVPPPMKMEIASSYKPLEQVSTLYTMEELKHWEDYQQLPTFQHSQHQRILNALCDDESCSYGGQSAMAGMNLEEFKKHIQEGSEAMLASMNPFGFISREIEHIKTCLNTLLLIEYSVLTVSVMISAVLYGATATLGALITRITLNWALLKSRKGPRVESVQMERLVSNM